MKKITQNCYTDKKISFQQPNTLENFIKSAAIEHRKSSQKLSKTLKQAEKVFQLNGADKNTTSPLYSETKKNLLDKKDAKITKKSHALKVM